MLPERRRLAGTITQSRTASAIQPLDCGPPATALAEIALTIACRTKPNTTVAAEHRAEPRHGRSLTISVSRITP